MQLTKGAIGNLINRYKAVLKKCHLLNVFGSLAVAGMLVMSGAAAAGAGEYVNPPESGSVKWDSENGSKQNLEKGQSGISWGSPNKTSAISGLSNAGTIWVVNTKETRDYSYGMHGGENTGTIYVNGTVDSIFLHPGARVAGMSVTGQTAINKGTIVVASGSGMLDNSGSEKANSMINSGRIVVEGQNASGIFHRMTASEEGMVANTGEIFVSTGKGVWLANDYPKDVDPSFDNKKFSNAGLIQADGKKSTGISLESYSLAGIGTTSNATIDNTGGSIIAQNGATGINNGTATGTTVKGGTIEAYGNSTAIKVGWNGSLTLDGETHVIIDSSSFAADVATNGTLTVQDGAKLTITDAVAGGNYEVVTGNGALDIKGGAWSGDNLQASSDMVVLTSTDGKTFTAEGRDAHDVFTGLDDSMGDAVNSLYARHGAAGTDGWNYADVNAEERGIRFLSRATDKLFIGGDHQAAAATIESASRIAFAGAVPQMTKMASDAASNAVVNRLGFANPADGAQAMDAEGKIVDRNTTGFALWIAPLWQNQHGWGMEADSMDYGFNGNLGGVSLGADYTFENAIRAGITFNIGGGYAESSGGDLNSTENNMSFWGLGAYAGWNYENFGLMADVSYTSTWNDLKQDLDSRMGMGDLEADVQASAISAGLRAEYKLETSVLDIIPHIGVRYMSLNTWGYDVDADGGTVLEGDGFHQDIWTFPVGVTFSKDITLDSGWFFKPSVDFSVIPAAGDIKAKSEVAFTGLPGTYEVETQMMDYLTWQGGVGLEMGNDTMSFGVNYTLQAGQHSTGHGVFGSFRYEF